MLEERNLETVLDALADKIRELKVDLRIKEMDICRLKDRNKELEIENAELYKLLAERNTKNDTD